jgi:hypothetical protein
VRVSNYEDSFCAKAMEKAETFKCHKMEQPTISSKSQRTNGRVVSVLCAIPCGAMFAHKPIMCDAFLVLRKNLHFVFVLVILTSDFYLTLLLLLLHSRTFR